jgi:hypothetical protein
MLRGLLLMPVVKELSTYFQMDFEGSSNVSSPHLCTQLTRTTRPLQTHQDRYWLGLFG